jgi:peptidylprolyl isomerase
MTAELKIEDIVTGTGKTAERGALITTHYRGWLEDGSEFDSSHKNNPAF